MADDPVRRLTVVIGAGPAGLAAAAALRARGVPSLILERDTVAASWRGHYDRLHLHTVRWLSHLPGYRIPREEGPWVSRDGVVRYLEHYAAHHGLEIRTGVRVERIEREPHGWLLKTQTGAVRAAAVVVATGYNHTPVEPDWPGREGYTGELLHARDYRNGEPYRGRDVLVAGAGNTGAEIAVDLAEHGAARVWLAVRTPPYVLRRSQLGVPTQLTGVLLRYVPAAIVDLLAEPVRRMSVPRMDHKGLPDPGPGLYSRAAKGSIPVLDVGLVDAVLADRVQPVAAVTGFDGAKVCLADGSTIAPEVVVTATGYRRGLQDMVGHLGVLDRAGRPRPHGRRTHPAAPGLYFIGYTNPVSGMFREIAIDARRIAAAIARRLKGRTS